MVFTRPTYKHGEAIRTETGVWFLYDFSDFVFEDRLDNVPTVLLPSRHRFYKMPRLLRTDLARQGWLVGIHRRLNEDRP